MSGSKSKRVKHAKTLAILIAMTTTGACVFLKTSQACLRLIIHDHYNKGTSNYSPCPRVSHPWHIYISEEQIM